MNFSSQRLPHSLFVGSNKTHAHTTMAAHAITPTPGGGGQGTATDDRRDAPASASADGTANGAVAGADNTQPSVVISSLTFSYPGAATPVLSSMSMSLPRGATCLLVGANGAGEGMARRGSKKAFLH